MVVLSHNFKKVFVTSYLILTFFSSSFHVGAIRYPQTDLAAQKYYNESKVTNRSIIFNITDDAESYMNFIRDIRVVLTSTVSNGIPVLTPQPWSETPSTVSWLDVRLVFNEQTSITVRLDQSNLYVRGYARNNDAVFWEFSDSSLIPNSRSLRFSGSYTNGLMRTADITRVELLLGFYALQNAVITLANTDNPPASPRDPARSLVVIVQMIAEATRIQIIANFLRVNWLNPRAVTPRMEILENGWSRLSTAVQFTNQSTATANTLLPNIPADNPTLIWTLGQATVAFGILLFHRDRGSRPLTTTQAVSETVSVYGARVLMNLEYVRINNIDGENPGDLFGTVRVDDGWYNYTFYNRSSSGSESKAPGGFATLTDPFYVGGAISGEDGFVVAVSLFDYDASSANDEIAQGDVVWDPRVENINSTNYDTHLQSVVKGKYGDVTVGYAVMSDALSVAIDVVLINGDGESPADVYGTVKTSQVLGGSVGLAAMSLFGRSAKESVQVKPQQSIPLTRKVVAASVYAPLTVTADLWDYDTSSSDDPIGQGSVDFVVKVGTQKSTILGKYGQVLVSVTCQ